MKALTRFELARTVLNHQLVLGLDEAETLQETAVSGQGLMLAYQAKVLELYNTEEWDGAAGVTVPMIDVFSQNISHETCTGNTQMEVRFSARNPKLNIWRPNPDCQFDLTQWRDAFLYLLGSANHPRAGYYEAREHLTSDNPAAERQQRIETAQNTLATEEGNARPTLLLEAAKLLGDDEYLGYWARDTVAEAQNLETFKVRQQGDVLTIASKLHLPTYFEWAKEYGIPVSREKEFVVEMKAYGYDVVRAS